MIYGITIGWQSPTAPQLQSTNSPLGSEPMTNDEVSWLTAIMCLVAAFVSLGIGTVAEKYGRKIFGCLGILPFSISWLLLIFATEHWHLYVARFFSGLSAGIILYVVPRYVSEISCDEIRGMLSSMLLLILNSGILLAYILGAVVSFRMFGIISFGLSLCYFVFIFFLPESPVYLVRQNRLPEAAR